MKMQFRFLSEDDATIAHLPVFVSPFNNVEDIGSRAHRSSSLRHVPGDERLLYLSKGKGREVKAPPDNGPELQGFQPRRPGLRGPVV